MFRSVKYKRPDLGSPPGTSGIIIVRDSCFGEVRIKRNHIHDINVCFIYAVIGIYSRRHLNIMTNLVKCLRFLYREHGTKLNHLLDVSEPVVNKLLPSVNFSKYEPLLRKVHIPHILSRYQ